MDDEELCAISSLQRDGRTLKHRVGVMWETVVEQRVLKFEAGVSICMWKAYGDIGGRARKAP
jgi:hypothetical protein